jgi:hypothetical protein
MSVIDDTVAETEYPVDMARQLVWSSRLKPRVHLVAVSKEPLRVVYHVDRFVATLPAWASAFSQAGK